MSPEPSRTERGDSRPAAEADPVAVLDALGDETCREILRAADGGGATVEELAAECSVSESTVYRRLSDLGDLGLVEPTNWPVADEGNEYETTLETALVTLDDGDFSLSLNDGGDVEAVVERLESLVDVEDVAYDRESRRVEFEITASEELFELLLRQGY